MIAPLTLTLLAPLEVLAPLTPLKRMLLLVLLEGLLLIVSLEGFILLAPPEALALPVPLQGLLLRDLLEGLVLLVPLEALTPLVSLSTSCTGSLPLPCSPPVLWQGLPSKRHLLVCLAVSDHLQKVRIAVFIVEYSYFLPLSSL